MDNDMQVAWNWYGKPAIICTLTIALIGICVWAHGATVDMDKIKMIESSGNPLAYNKGSGARGLYQITKIALDDYNNYHPTEKYTLESLWKPQINAKIAKWYLDTRIPQMLHHYGKESSIDNILISYNCGISCAINNKPLPKETINYIKKYKGE